jgi:diaminohydroxyphosphoribosylaminopyrimidine deaminase / 5-amino-6-(5-phosphoribosylamino)uracil reductase
VSVANPTAQQQADEFWMRKALGLATRAEGLTRPNPPVGAVVVKNGRLISTGFHKKAGKPHAEALALKSAGKRARGATLYVTLEPCSTFGRTPPCTDAILRSSVSRLVISVRDPNPKHSGYGLALLKKAGVEVVEGVCSNEGAALIAPFAKWIKTGVPYLTLKMAMSLDGKIADHTGKSKWISCEKSRAIVMQLRRKADAILVGRQTVRVDNPSLMIEERAHTLFRVVVDSAGQVPLSAKILNDGNAARTVIATTKRCPSGRAKAYMSKGAQVWILPSADGKVSLKHLFRRLGSLGLLHILCEGGGELAGGLVKAGLVDEYVFFVSPLLLGATGHSVGAVAGTNWLLKNAPRLEFTDWTRVGDDIMIRAVPR